MPDPNRLSLSATESPALFNASPYATRWTLYQKFRHGIENAQDEDNRMSWGKKLQPLLLSTAAEDLKLVVNANAGDAYMRRGLLGCTRDAEIICPTRGPGALEAKVVFDYRIWMEKWGGGEAVPREIEIQLQQQMYVGDEKTPYEWGTISVLVCGEMQYFERKPIPALWAGLEDESRQFFDDVANDREPEPFGVPVEKELMLQCFPTIVGNILDLRTDELQREIEAALDTGSVPEDLMAELKRRQACAQDVADMQYHAESRLGHDRAEKAIKARLLALAAGHESVLLPYGCNVKVKQQSRAGYMVKPSAFQVVSGYAPEGAPRGDILGLEPIR